MPRTTRAFCPKCKNECEPARNPNEGTTMSVFSCYKGGGEEWFDGPLVGFVCKGCRTTFYVVSKGK